MLSRTYQRVTASGALCERLMMQRISDKRLHMIERFMTKTKMRTIRPIAGNAADHTEHTAHAARSAEERGKFFRKHTPRSISHFNF